MTDAPKMVTYQCPTCGTKVRVIDSAKGGTCDNGGKHKQVQMKRIGRK